MGTLNDPSPQELGFEGPPAPPVLPDGPPLGKGKFAVPQWQTFAGVVNSINHVYPYTFDEAQLHSRENADRMRQDPVINFCLRLRMMAVALLTWHIEPDDPDNADEVQAAADTEMHLRRMPHMLNMHRCLLDAEWVGRSAWQNRWKWTFPRGIRIMMPVRGGRHIDGDKLVFHWDESVGIRVHAAFPGPTVMTDEGRAYMLTPEEREQVIVHQFEPTDATYYRYHMAGSIMGKGLRNNLYWLWALKSRIWALSVDYLEWFAQGLTAYYFQSGNDAHKQEVISWLQQQQGNKVIVWPRFSDGGPGYKPIERFEPNTNSSNFLQTLITSYFDDLIIQTILGQTLTSGTAPTGLGSGVSQAHQGTFENIVKYSAQGLQETYTYDFLRVYYKHNYPGMQHGRWVFDVDDPNIQQMIENAESIYQMGGRVEEESLLDAAGLPVPGPESTVLSNVQPMQPAAVDEQPAGTPVVQLSRSQVSRIMKRVFGPRWRY